MNLLRYIPLVFHDSSVCICICSGGWRWRPFLILYLLDHKPRSNVKCCSLLVDDEAAEDSVLPRGNGGKGCGEHVRNRRALGDRSAGAPGSSCVSGLSRFTPNSLTRLASAWLWRSGCELRTNGGALPLSCCTPTCGAAPATDDPKKWNWSALVVPEIMVS